MSKKKLATVWTGMASDTSGWYPGPRDTKLSKAAVQKALDYCENGEPLDPAQVFTNPDCRSFVSADGLVMAQVWVILWPSDGSKILKRAKAQGRTVSRG